MSCIFIAAPLVVMSGGWPVFAAAALTAGASLGYRKAKKGVADSREVLDEVEVAMEGSELISDSLSEDESLTMQKDGMEVEFYKDPRGQVGVYVRARGMDKKKLKEEGEKIIGRVKQQYAYQRVMDELEKKGYALQSEESASDQTIRIRLTRDS